MIWLKQEAREVISQHCEFLKNSWINRFALDSKFLVKCNSFIFHSELWRSRQLACQYTQGEVSPESMLEYIQNCVYMLELMLLRNKNTDGILAHFEVIFSPQVSMSLPCLNENHINSVRRSHNSMSCFREKICNDLGYLTGSDRGKLIIDSWISLWRFSCISFPDLKLLQTKLDEIEKKIKWQQGASSSWISFLEKRQTLYPCISFLAKFVYTNQGEVSSSLASQLGYFVFPWDSCRKSEYYVYFHCQHCQCPYNSLHSSSCYDSLYKCC